MKFHIFFCDFYAFWGEGYLQNHWKSYRNSIGFGAGGAEGPILMEFREIMCHFMNHHEIPLNFITIEKLHEIPHDFGEFYNFKVKGGSRGAPGRGCPTGGREGMDSPTEILL